MMSTAHCRSKTREFVAGFCRNKDLADDHDIFALGFVNSLFAMQLVLFLEKEFQITIENEDLEIENFNTLNAIASLVERKTLASSQGVAANHGD